MAAVFGLVFCAVACMEPLVLLTGMFPKFSVVGCTVKVDCTAVTRRMRELYKSVTKRRPEASKVTPQVSAMTISP
jgi:hypothetical protein